jgi:hypothetical protein
MGNVEVAPTVGYRVQDDPYVGAPLPSADVVITDRSVQIYVNAVNDETFWAFQARTLAREGIKVPPLMVVDRDMTARIVGGPGRSIGFHARQEFRFNEPLEVGKTYRISGQVTDVSERRGIGYFTTRTVCAPVDDPGLICQESFYTRAFRFARQQYPKSTGQAKLSITDWMNQHGFDSGAVFPAIGSVIEGRTSTLDSVRLALYSDADSVLHSDPVLSRRRGLRSIVAQALMATELECEMYRDMFGLAFYKRGHILAKYMDPIPVDVQLRAMCIVTSASPEEITLDSAVAATTGEVKTIATVTVRDWMND